MSATDDVPNQVTATEHAALRERIARLIRLKIPADTLIPISAWLALFLGEAGNDQLWSIFWTGLVLLGLDLTFIVAHHWLAHRSYNSAVVATFISGFITALVITVSLHLTGGFANPLVVFYILNALAIAIVLQRTRAVSMMLAGSAIMYTLLAVVELRVISPPITWLGFGFTLAPFMPLVLVAFTLIAMVSDRMFNQLTETNRALAQRTRQLEAAMRDQARLYRAEQRRAEQLRLVNQTTSSIANMLNPDELLSEVVHLIHDCFGYRAVGAALVHGDEWVIHASAGDLTAAESAVGLRYSITEGVVGWVIAQGQLVRLPDVAEDERYLRLPDHDSIQSALCVPLIIKGQVIGALNAESDQPAAFDEEDTTVMQSIATVVASALDSARLFQQAAQERDRLQSIVHSVAEGVLVTDTRNRVIVVNPPLCEWWGLSEEEIVGRSLAQILDSLGGGMQRVLHEEKGTSHAQRATIEIISPQYRILEQVTAPVSDPHGPTIGQVTVFHDVTEARHMSELQENLIQMLVHDLRSPLNIISNTLEFLEMTQEKEEDNQVIKTAQVSLTRLMNLINALLDVARLETGQFPLQKQPTTIPPLIQETIVLMAPFAEDRQVTIVSEIADKLPDCRIDRELTSRIMVNLVTNGIQHTPAGGQVTIGAQVPEATPGEIWLSVQDTGKGIRPEDQTRIFDKFVQVGTTRRQGSGLGLTFCRLATEAHGGRIWVESEDGAGSTFNVTLPLGLDTPA